MQIHLSELARLRAEGRPVGIASVCSAHPLVLRAVLRHGRLHSSTVLIEATCNQVNHLGGYTDMTPADFAALVRHIAEEENCPSKLVVLGDDYPGPNPWRDRTAEEAMPSKDYATHCVARSCRFRCSGTICRLPGTSRMRRRAGATTIDS
jgi:D-tagatose-1,6-bisphosphate aldolase subunit GatZ/KbaZ